MSLHEILAQHRRASQGMTYGSPDRCLCGEKVYPESGGEDVDVRRHRAFAAHQAKVLDAHPALEAGVTLTEAERRSICLTCSVLTDQEHDPENDERCSAAEVAYPAVERILAARQAPTVALDVETVARVTRAHRHKSGVSKCECGEDAGPSLITNADHAGHLAAAVVAADPAARRPR